jgi:hypothetical protein
VVPRDLPATRSVSSPHLRLLYGSPRLYHDVNGKPMLGEARMR